LHHEDQDIGSRKRESGWSGATGDWRRFDQGGRHMIRLSIEVHSGSANFKVAVWAYGIEQALSLAKACYPGAKARVVFPIEPEAFFVRGIVPPHGLVQPEMPEEAAG
jgi:hypothetical protein